MVRCLSSVVEATSGSMEISSMLEFYMMIRQIALMSWVGIQPLSATISGTLWVCRLTMTMVKCPCGWMAN